ncbi:MAG: translation initiation factor [Synergistota bacterium]|nr:translation initiation factor [Synergistota bacterium]
MSRQAKNARVDTGADAGPLSLSLGELMGVEVSPRSPEDAKADRKPAPPRELPGRVVLSRETKGRGGKTMTRISFREGAPSDAEGLAKRLRGALGCGGSMEGDDILLQGDQVERARSWFESRGVRVSGPR